MDVKNVLEKYKNVKNVKSGQNKKSLKTLNKKTLALICSTLMPNTVGAI